MANKKPMDNGRRIYEPSRLNPKESARKDDRRIITKTHLKKMRPVDWIAILVLIAFVIIGYFSFFSGNSHDTINPTEDTSSKTCPATSCEAGSCCCDREVQSGFVICRVLDDNVQIPISCDCPTDTHYVGTIDVQGITAKDCACNECPASCST